MTKRDIHQLLSKFSIQEEVFLESEFLAPKLRGVDVNVRIGGAVCRLRAFPPGFQGWGIFRPTSLNHAELQRHASLTERRRYLALLPRVPLIIGRYDGRCWFGSSANFDDPKCQVEGAAPIQFATGVQTFDVVHARFDGQRFWFEDMDTRRDPKTAARLRAALDQQVHPRDVSVAGLTAELRATYASVYQLRYEPVVTAQPAVEWQPIASSSDDAVRERLQRSLSHAGAQLVGYAEHADGYRVTYRVDGFEHVSSFDKRDLSVQSAGFCLDDLDHQFDMASLVSVAREGHGTGAIEGDDYD